MDKKINLMYIMLLLLSNTGYCQMNEIFSDDFDNNKNEWLEYNFKYDDKLYQIQDGKYFVGNFSKKTGTRRWSYKKIKIDTEKDFTIETSFLISEGADDRPTMGGLILFGYDPDDGNYHQVSLERKDGIYRVYIGDYSYGEWYIYGGYHIAKIYEKDYKNKIKIQKIGQTVKYYVNNEYITSHTFRPFYGDYVALGAIASTFVGFDYLIIKQN